MAEPKSPPKSTEQVNAVIAAINEAREAEPVETGLVPAESEGEQKRAGFGLPEGCPVVPLGVRGKICFYLDAAHQLIDIRRRDHSRLEIMGLFGRRSDLLYKFWPRISNDIVVGWRPELAAEALVNAAHTVGVWDPFGRVRGTGAWAGEDGELVLHTGGGIYVGPKEEGGGGEWLPPGAVGRYVYPAAAPGPRPAAEPQGAGEDGPAGELLKLYKCWNWRRGETDAMLLLGWTGAAMLSGALKWRPLVWITGRRNTGKSTLRQDLLEHVFDGELLSVSDATEAAIWQRLGYAALPVALDEVEAEEDNRRAGRVIRLARQATSGGIIIRGGADHQGADFIARSCFLFSSILVPPLLAQDRSRMAILELERIDREAERPKLEPRRLRAIGSGLRRRLTDGWWRLGEAIDQWRAALAEAGHDGRGCDQFGTLLACADIMLYDHAVSSDELTSWAEKLSAATLAEREDDAEDETRCLGHLLSSILDPYRKGARRSVAEWISEAAGDSHRAPPGGEEPALPDAIEANRILGTYGLRIVEAEGRRWLAVANSHQGVAALYHGTHWASKSGASGVWAQALTRLPGAVRGANTIWFAGSVARVTLIPLEVVLPREEGGGEQSVPF